MPNDRIPAAQDTGERKEYEKPAIIHTERIEARAVVCSKAPSACNPGPAHS